MTICRRDFSVSQEGIRRRVSSVVEHSSTNPKVPSLIPGPVSYQVMVYDEAYFMHLTPGVIHNFPKAVGV